MNNKKRIIAINYNDMNETIHKQFVKILTVDDGGVFETLHVRKVSNNGRDYIDYQYKTITIEDIKNMNFRNVVLQEVYVNTSTEFRFASYGLFSLVIRSDGKEQFTIYDDVVISVNDIFTNIKNANNIVDILHRKLDKHSTSPEYIQSNTDAALRNISFFLRTFYPGVYHEISAVGLLLLNV